MSASASQSESQQQSTQLTTQGGSGTTNTAAGNISYNDPALSLEGLKLAGQAIIAALGNNSDLQTQVAQQGAQQQANNSDLIQQVLNNEQNLAAAAATGGKTLDTGLTKYLIWGGIGIAGLAIITIFGNRKSS